MQDADDLLLTGSIQNEGRGERRDHGTSRLAGERECAGVGANERDVGVVTVTGGADHLPRDIEADPTLIMSGGAASQCARARPELDNRALRRKAGGGHVLPTCPLAVEEAGGEPVIEVRGGTIEGRERDALNSGANAIPSLGWLARIKSVA